MEDIASFGEWFMENEVCWIIPYIEKNYKPVSWEHQYNFMKQHLYFTRKIIADAKLSSDSKLSRFYKMISFGKSKIITIIGGRGSGKTAFAMFLIEVLYTEGLHKKIYYIKKGDRPEWLPEWIHHAQTMEDVPNKSFAVFDETAIEIGARNAFQDENKSFTERLVVLRHKDISVLLITQHSKLVDINIRRLSDILIYKMGANIEKEGEEDDEKYLIIKRLMPKDKTHSLIEIKLTGQFWTIETGLAEFWDDELVSKTFKNYNPEKVKREDRTKKYQEGLRQLQEKENIRAEALAKRNLIKEQKQPRKEVLNPEDLIEA